MVVEQKSLLSPIQTGRYLIYICGFRCKLNTSKPLCGLPRQILCSCNLHSSRVYSQVLEGIADGMHPKDRVLKRRLFRRTFHGICQESHLLVVPKAMKIKKMNRSTDSKTYLVVVHWNIYGTGKSEIKRRQIVLPRLRSQSRVTEKSAKYYVQQLTII